MGTPINSLVLARALLKGPGHLRATLETDEGIAAIADEEAVLKLAAVARALEKNLGTNAGVDLQLLLGLQDEYQFLEQRAPKVLERRVPQGTSSVERAMEMYHSARRIANTFRGVSRKTFDEAARGPRNEMREVISRFESKERVVAKVRQALLKRARAGQ